MYALFTLALMIGVEYSNTILSYADKARVLLWKFCIAYWYPMPVEITPSSRYFLGYPSLDIETHLTVPTDAVYVEEWLQEDTKKCVVKYSGESIPRTWTESPVSKNARTPWIWVGDRDTEIDLTRTFNKFVVVGNRITSTLASNLIRMTPTTHLMYIESGTFKVLEFPGDGITIEDYVDRPVQNCGSVHRAEEPVPASVMGGRDDSVE
jgi:hypothetical protein